MARNRKNESAAARLGPALRALLLCSFFVASGVGYVWYKDQINSLGREQKQREIRLAELERQNKVRRDQLAALCSPLALDARVKKLNLNLAPASLAQVIRLVDAAPEPPLAASAESKLQRQALAGALQRGN